MIISVGNIKGGVGKSTIACNLAVLLAQSGSVVLVDGDRQGSAAEFTAQREANRTDGAGYVCARALGAEVRALVKGLRARHDAIVIDAGGQDNPALRASLTVADVVVVPVPPKSFDTWALDAMAELIREVRETVNEGLRAVAVINMGYASGGDNEAAQGLLRDYPEFELAPVVICQRKTFSDCAGRGLAVIEAPRRDEKAVAELMALATALKIDHPTPMA